MSEEEEDYDDYKDRHVKEEPEDTSYRSRKDRKNDPNRGSNTTCPGCNEEMEKQHRTCFGRAKENEHLSFHSGCARAVDFVREADNNTYGVPALKIIASKANKMLAEMKQRRGSQHAEW